MFDHIRKNRQRSSQSHEKQCLTDKQSQVADKIFSETDKEINDPDQEKQRGRQGKKAAVRKSHQTEKSFIQCSKEQSKKQNPKKILLFLMSGIRP